MRTHLLALLAVASPLAASAQQKVSIQRAATAAPSVRLNGAISSITVIGWDRDSISLTGSLGPGSRMDGGPSVVSGAVSGLKFYVEAPDESSQRSNRLELRVPRNARVWIKCGSAEVEASGVTGGLDLNVVGGSVRVSGGPRELIVEAMDGSVEVTGGLSFARIKTATGDVQVSGGGEDLTATTVSGAILVTKGEFQRARLESVTGPITFSADFARGADARFDTHSGSIELRLPPRAALELDAATVTGMIENAWSRSRPVAGREGRGMELGLSAGTAGAHVTIRSFKGGVKLVPR
jgi:hypothetical protein